MKARIATLLGIALLAAPVAARADSHLVPPGKSGAEQYFENVPTARGNAAPPAGTTAPPKAGAGATTTARRGLRALTHLGKDGDAAAKLAAGGAPPAARAPLHDPQTGGGAGAAVSTALDGSHGGLGVLFPVLLAVSLAAAIFAGVARRRRGEPAT